MILLDTNIALRLADPSHTLHGVAKTAVSVLQSRGEMLCIVPQIIYEFWTVATRPIAVNGLGFSASECQAAIAHLKGFTDFLPDQPSLFAEWETLVVTYVCLGKPAHDARLVAAMRTHGVTRILTFILHAGRNDTFPHLPADAT